jgi:hypothetical protein
MLYWYAMAGLPLAARWFGLANFNLVLAALIFV